MLRPFPRHRAAFPLLTAAAVSLSLAGCGGGLLGDDPSADTTTIAFMVPVAANPYWALEVEYAEAAADQLGIEIDVTDANSQEDAQINQVQAQISSGVDGIVIAPVSDAVGSTVLDAAESADIPVVFMQRSPGIEPDEYDGDAYVGFVGTDDVQGGELTAQALYDAGARSIVAITGAQGNSAAEGRIAGLQNVAAEHPDLEILQTEYGNELREDGLQTTENLLSAYPGPGFDGVWTFNDETAIGATRALSGTDVVVTGMDGTPEGVQSVLDGELLSAPGGGYVNGAFSVVLLFDHLNGFEPDDDYVLMPLSNVTAENAAAFQALLDDPSSFDFTAVSRTENPEASTDDFVVSVD